VGSRRELCDTPVCISRGVDSSPSTITLNFLLERRDLISLIKLDENCNLDSLYSKPVPCSVKGFFDIEENRSRGHTEVYGHVVRKPHTLKRRAVTCTKAKLARIQYVIVLNIHLDCSYDDFFK